MLPWWKSKVKGIYVFSASPFTQRAFYGIWDDVKKFVKIHIAQPGAFVTVPMIFGSIYLVNYLNRTYALSKRKNREDYELEYQKNLREVENGT